MTVLSWRPAAGGPGSSCACPHLLPRRAGRALKRPPWAAFTLTFSQEVTMNARSITVLAALSITGLAGAQCVKAPTHAFNGLVKIPYPSGGGGALLQ